MNSDHLAYYLIILFLVKSCSGQWTQITQGTSSQPAHTFQISHYRSDSVSGVVSWDDPDTDLDLYVYTNNEPLFILDRAAAKFVSNIDNGPQEQFQFRSISTNTGILYLRVHPYLISSTYVNYQIQITISNRRTGRSDYLEFSGSICREQQFMNYVNIGNLGLNKGYLKFEIDEATDIKMKIPKLGNSDISAGSPVQLPSRPDSTWIVIFTHPTANINSLQSYSYKIFYNPHNNPNPDPNNNTTLSQQQINVGIFNPNQIPIIAGLVIGGLVFIFILIGVGYAVYRKRKRNARPVEQPGSLENIMTRSIPRERQICSICLDGNLNARLPCLHRFHEDCIKEWLGRNQRCPLCRNVFQASNISMSILVG